MIELAILAMILFSGWMILAAFGMRGWTIIPLGFLVGTFVVVVVAFFLVVTGLPTYPWVVLSAALLLSAGVLVGLRGRRSLQLTHLAVGMALLVPLVITFTSANLVNYHIDSFRYLVASGLLANNSFEIASLNLLEKRLLSAPVIHSLSDLSGERYLQSYSPILSLALMGLLAWGVSQGRPGTTIKRRGLVITTLAVLLVATNNRMVFNSLYINDHLVFGAAFLVICCASWLRGRGVQPDDSPLVVAAVLALPVLVVTRPEGFIVGAIAILPLILHEHASLRTRRLVLIVYALSTVAWFSFVAIARYEATGGVALTEMGPVLVGLFGFATVPVLRWAKLTNWRRAILLIVEVGLWLALALFALSDPGILTRSLRATFENLLRGAGSWGYSLVLLSAIALTAMLLAKDKVLVHLRFPLTALLPVMFLLAYLRNGAYRVGNGDSLNRMLMQFVPVVVLYVSAAAWRQVSDSSTRS